MLQIFVPTLLRGYSDTAVELNKAGVDFTWVHDENHLKRDTNSIVCPERGIGKVRQWIIDNAKSNKVLMLDDDLVFATRRSDEPTKFRPSTPEEIKNLFSDIDKFLDSFAHVGVSTREGGNRDTSSHSFNTRLLRVLGYRVDVLRNNKIRFDRMELMEDFDVTLQLLRAGYSNIKINGIVHNQRSSNAPGGCSTYRTAEKQSQAARRLHELHPSFVTVVTKQTKTAWNGKEREDVRIAWKNAWDSSPTVSLLDPGTEPSTAQEGTG